MSTQVLQSSQTTVVHTTPVRYQVTWLNGAAEEQALAGWMIRFDAEHFARWVAAQGMALEDAVMVEPYWDAP